MYFSPEQNLEESFVMLTRNKIINERFLPVSLYSSILALSRIYYGNID